MLNFEDAIAGCLRNDNKSKEMVYKSFYGYLMGITLRYVDGRNDAEELVNDSFIKIFKSIGQFNTPQYGDQVQKSFKAWIGKIASRTAIDFLRGKRTFLSIDDILEEQQPLIELSAISQLNVQDIMKLLNKLPETHKLIFNMHEIEGFTHEELSKMLDIPENSCRVYLTRAKNRLRELYKNSVMNSYGPTTIQNTRSV